MTTVWKAAAAKVRITPETTAPLQGYNPDVYVADPAKDMHAELYARLLLLDDGETRLLFVGVDTCLANEAESVVVRQDGAAGCYRVFPGTWPPGTRAAWGAAAGVPSGAVIVAATHTHTAPARVDASLCARVEAAARELAERLQPVRLYAGRGTSGLAAYRRPDLDPHPEVPVDRSLYAALWETPDGRPIGGLVNYAVHPTLLRPPNRLSPDFVGLAMDRLEARRGGGFVSVFAQGFSGDLAPVYGGHGAADDTTPLVAESAERLAADAAAAESARVAMDSAPLSSLEDTVALPRRAEFFDGPLEVRFTLFRLAAQLAVIAVSAEVFNGLAAKVRARSPFAHTLLVGVANGYAGYIPESGAFRDGLGGYELRTTPFTEEAEDLLLEALAAALHKLCQTHN